MARPFLPQIATASHLLEGDAVYFTAHGNWSRSLNDAIVAQTPAHAETLLHDASQSPNEVVGPYLANVRVETGKPVPAHFREMFRTLGPSNYFHGKQAAPPREAAQPRPPRRDATVVPRVPGLIPGQPGEGAHVQL